MQGDCSGPRSDNGNFARLVADLKDEFKPRGLLLSAAVSASKIVIDMAYDVPHFVRHLDWIAVMAYDYHGSWENVTGHIAPLYRHPSDGSLFLNVNFSMRYWLDKGVPGDKIILGVPAYGQSFTLSERAQSNAPGFHAETTGPGQPGRFTKSAGFLAYYEASAY